MTRALLYWFTLLSVASIAQPSSEIKLKLKKLNVLGTALYVAAHPDDENTRAITFYANEKLFTSGYLSMTRGDGGQNLIGPEIRDLLGIIRTNELLAARSLDGGHQFFTRANDFGFSKNATETLTIWDKQTVLSDVVRIFREFQPDIILTRFPPDERAGHGHHTSSAMLAQEAFNLAGDANAFPESAKQFGVWQPKRLYTNSGRFFNRNLSETTPGIITVDMGGYNPLTGKSYSEIAAASRTMHKSQGFGSQGRRGEAIEFFEFAVGEKAEKDLLEGINTTWARVKGAEAIPALVDKAIIDFNDDKPYLSVAQLVLIRKEINKLSEGLWKSRKLKEVDQLIKDCLGLFVDATTNAFHVNPGSEVNLNFELINRSPISVTLSAISSSILGIDSTASKEMMFNKPVLLKSKKVLNSTAEYSGPYWLKQEHGIGIFNVANDKLIGRPLGPDPVTVHFTFNVLGESITYTDAVDFKVTDPVKGELSRPAEITPPVFVNIEKPVYVFAKTSPKQVVVRVKSASGNIVSGNVQLELPLGWISEPLNAPFQLAKRGDEQKILFMVTPGQGESESAFKASATVEGKSHNLSLLEINYDHIPVQTLLHPAKAKALRMNIQKMGSVVGYIKGAGDDGPDALRNLGYEVWEMKEEEVTPNNLKRVDAVVLGVRLFNTSKLVKHYMPTLLEYVKGGGTVVAQYNTNFDLELEQFSPYPLTISRERVTEENSEVRILNPDHPLMNTPNKITASDFNGWVQERGLYFPNKWDTQFEPLLSMNDAKEPAREGALLVAKYGTGHYIYTGLSFFRELPEGVAGAYKLFANLVSAGKSNAPQPQKVRKSKK